MATTLKEETILNEWSMIVDHGAGNGPAVLDQIQKCLGEARIPGDCAWCLEEVKSQGLFSKVRREFLIVSLGQFKDYHMYIGIRDYGIHLDCCRFLTVEPGLFKKMLSEKLTGSADTYSMPRNILVEQDLRAWATVVHHGVTDAVGALLTRLGQDPTLLQKGTKGILEIW